MKKLNQQEFSSNEKKDSIQQNGFESILITPIVQNEHEAIEKKLELLRGRIFGKPIIKFDLGNMRRVWVPYWYLVYDFHIKRKVFISNSSFDKAGKVALVFDLNEAHPFQYDLGESGDLQLVRAQKNNLNESFLQVNSTDSEILEMAEWHIQTKIFRRFYGANGELTISKSKKFFRPAVEIEVLYKGENLNLRYAYLDEFGIDSEHILGLKYRVNNT